MPGIATAPKTVEKFDSEVWEAKKDELINEIAEAVFAKTLEGKDGLTEDEAFELACLMSRYSLKDGLELVHAASGFFSDQQVAAMIREYGGRHELQQKLVAGSSLKERLLTFIDYRLASPLGACLNGDSKSFWSDREEKADKFVEESPDLAAKDPYLAEKLKILLREQDDTDPDRPGGSGIGNLTFTDQAAPFKERIDRLYDAFYENPSIEGMGKVKKEEVSSTVTEASAFLAEFVELVKDKPVYFVPVQEWLFKEIFRTKVKIEGLRWPDVDVESAFTPGKKMPLREAIKEYRDTAKVKDGKSSFTHKWAMDEAFREPVDAGNLRISRKKIEEYLEDMDIDPARLDVQSLLKRNSVSKLDTTFKMQCKAYSDRLLEENNRTLEKIRALQKAGKTDMKGLNYQYNVTRELQEIYASLLKGEMDELRVRMHLNSTAAFSAKFSADLKEKNFASRIQSSSIFDFFRQPKSEEVREVRPAKIDHFSRRELEEAFHQIFPLINLDELNALRKANGAADATRVKKEAGIYGPSTYFDPEHKSYGVDGDPRDPWPVELMKISESIDAILVTGVYNQRDEAEGSWESDGSTLTTHSPEDLPRKTVVFQLVPYVGMALPTALHGIPIQRVIGITWKGKQVPVVTTKDAMGRTIVESFSPDVKDIAYAQEIPELLPSVTDVSEVEYQAWLKRQEKKGERRQTKEQAYRLLPADCKRFVDEIRPLQPAERVRRVETFVREIGYYDFKNGETEGERVGTSLQIRWNLMRQRMKKLQSEKPTDKELASKKIAGVCVDFQEITTLLLSAVDCIAGKMSALRVHHDTKVTSQDAHALSYVEWPTPKGESMRIPVDGTPSGTNEEEQKDLNNIQELRQVERADKLEQYRFEHDMEEETVKIFPKKAEEEKPVFEKPLSTKEAVESFRKKEVVSNEDEFEGKKAPTLTRERMTEYLKTALSEQEMHALYRTVGWIAYGGVIEELTKLGVAEDAFDKEGRMKMELAQVYTQGTQDRLHQNQGVEASSIVHDWQNACNKLRPLGYTPTRLAALVADAMPRATDPGSKRDRSISYLGRIVNG